jgi:hypothetical protein
MCPKNDFTTSKGRGNITMVWGNITKGWRNIII